MADLTATAGTDPTCFASIVPITRHVTEMRPADERRIAFLLSLSADLSASCRPRRAIRSYPTGNDRVRSPTSRLLGSNLWNQRGPAARRGVCSGLLGHTKFVILSLESPFLDQDRFLRDDRYAVNPADSAVDPMEQPTSDASRFYPFERADSAGSMVAAR